MTGHEGAAKEDEADGRRVIGVREPVISPTPAEGYYG
jgi:hypothetical protein